MFISQCCKSEVSMLQVATLYCHKSQVSMSQVDCLWSGSEKLWTWFEPGLGFRFGNFVKFVNPEPQLVGSGHRCAQQFRGLSHRQAGWITSRGLFLGRAWHFLLQGTCGQQPLLRVAVPRPISPPGRVDNITWFISGTSLAFSAAGYSTRVLIGLGTSLVKEI
jgi:hypothetical protein